MDVACAEHRVAHGGYLDLPGLVVDAAAAADRDDGLGEGERADDRRGHRRVAHPDVADHGEIAPGIDCRVSDGPAELCGANEFVVAHRVLDIDGAGRFADERSGFGEAHADELHRGVGDARQRVHRSCTRVNLVGLQNRCLRRVRGHPAGGDAVVAGEYDDLRRLNRSRGSFSLASRQPCADPREPAE